MPHFVIECTDELAHQSDIENLIRLVFDTAVDSGLFNPEDIKVRLRPYSHYTVAGQKNPFLHIFAWIMEGRTAEQKKRLSTDIVTVVKDVLPEVSVISMNVAEFEKATYCNAAMLDN